LHHSYRTIAFLAALPLLGGSAMLATLHAGSNIAYVYVGLALLGLGFGTFNSVFVVSVQGSVAWEMRGAATSSLIFMRQIGQAVGTSTFGAIFNIGIYSRLPDASGVVAQLVDPARRALIPPVDLARDAGAVGQSLHGVYLIALVLSVAVSALVLAIPPQLRSVPGEPVARGERVGHEA
jgi:hypothetical protein